ncbi:MAG TPA: hypothetical protein PKC43_04745 [Phycisphaerales bacterium]|nr:hypothetical protein [Phycisphaerales bacterium]HMP36736.1 hypothetical protein [Phycisphaerales bacterium]
MSRGGGKFARGALVLTASLAGLLPAGCNIVGPVLYVIEGPPKTPAAYRLQNVPTVVFVDDRANIMPRFDLRASIGDEASAVIMKHGGVTTVLSNRDILALARRQDTDKELMPMDALGRAAGADQLIYVRIVGFALTPDGQTPRPVAGAEVRVIDCVARTKAFPSEQNEKGRYVEATLKHATPDAYGSSGSRRQLEDALARKLGDAVAKLFYEYETRELGGNLR